MLDLLVQKARERYIRVEDPTPLATIAAALPERQPKEAE